MNAKQYGLILTLSMVAGLVGSIVSNRFLSGSPLSAQKTPQQAEIIRVERVEVVDKEGRRRARFGLAPQGNTGLGLYDQDGNVSAVLSMTPDRTTGLVLADRQGKRRAGLILSADGELALELYDKEKKCRVRLAVTTDG